MYSNTKFLVLSLVVFIVSFWLLVRYFNDSDKKEIKEKIAKNESIIKSGKIVPIIFSKKVNITSYDDKPISYTRRFKYFINKTVFTKEITVEEESQLVEYENYKTIVCSINDPEIYSFSPKEDLKKYKIELKNHNAKNTFNWYLLFIFMGSILGIYLSIITIKRIRDQY